MVWMAIACVVSDDDDDARLVHGETIVFMSLTAVVDMFRRHARGRYLD